MFAGLALCEYVGMLEIFAHFLFNLTFTLFPTNFNYLRTICAGLTAISALNTSVLHFDKSAHRVSLLNKRNKLLTSDLALVLLVETLVKSTHLHILFK
jgi:hypothetical protein